MPSLSSYDIHSITSVIKSFLNDLRETLITRFKWKDFVKAIEASDEEDKKSLLYQSLSELPEANRDTLSFLVLHLQKVAQTQENKYAKNSVMGIMTKSNLAKVLGPTLVGNSMSSSSTPENLWNDNKKAIQVLEMLLDLPQDYFQGFLKEQDQEQDSIRRVSIGNRPFAGTVDVNGILTPQKNIYGNKKQTQGTTRYLKPLF